MPGIIFKGFFRNEAVITRVCNPNNNTLSERPFNNSISNFGNSASNCNLLQSLFHKASVSEIVLMWEQIYFLRSSVMPQGKTMRFVYIFGGFLH